MGDRIVNPVQRAYRRYSIEFALSMVLYVAAIWVRNWLLHGPVRQATPALQCAVAIMPIVPVALVFAAIVRLLLHTDEMQRRVYVNALALAGGATALLAVTYGLIEGDFAPRLSAWWTYGTFMVSWLVATFFVRRRYR